MKMSVRDALTRSMRDGSAVLIAVVVIIVVLLAVGVDIVPWD